MSGGARQREDQGPARRRVLGPVPGAPARCVQLRLLPGGQPPRRRGSDRADLPSGIPALRAGAARIRRAAAAAVADPDRAQPRREPVPRPLAQAGVADRRDDHDHRASHDRAAGRGPGRAEPCPRGRPAAAGRPPGGADHALRAGHGQPRDRAGAGPLRRRHEGADPSRDQAARGDRRRAGRVHEPTTEKAGDD